MIIFININNYENSAMVTQKKRIATKPTRNSQKRRMDSKTKHANIKKMRGKVIAGE